MFSLPATGSFGIGVFSHDLTGLEENTTYYYRAKTHNSEGWGYGAEKSFITSEPEVELRLSDVDPPDPEPVRTIYRDIVNLPDPVLLGMTIRYFNHDDVGLYMQITGSGPGYTFGTVNLGLLGSGASAYQNLDEFASKAKPSVGDLPDGEMEENATLILRGYTDAGYSILKWTFERVVTVYWINSADAAFTVDFLNNFDDGTVQGWTATAEVGAVLSFNIATDYVLSPPYSAKLEYWNETSSYAISRMSKTFETPNKSKVFAIMDFRGSFLFPDTHYIRAVQIRNGGVVLVQIGEWSSAEADAMPKDKWMRVVVPLPPNSSVDLRIAAYGYRGAIPCHSCYLWLDDFKIISK